MILAIQHFVTFVLFSLFTCINLQKNTGQTDGPAGMDLRVEPVWLQNVTGDGIIVGVVDDGEVHLYTPMCVAVIYEALYSL